MLCWNPDSDQVAVVRWPDGNRRSAPYQMTALACNHDLHEMNFKQRKLMVFIEAMHLIVRDKVEPMAVHRALLALDEYRDGCSPDMPGLEAYE